MTILYLLIKGPKTQNFKECPFLTIGRLALKNVHAKFQVDRKSPIFHGFHGAKIVEVLFKI